MTEEPSLKTDIPGLFSLVEITVPRWAADEPVPGEMIDVAELPDNLEQEKLSFQGGGYRYYGKGYQIPEDQRFVLKGPTESQVVQSTYDRTGCLMESRRFEGNALIEEQNYHYDQKGRCIERLLKDPFDELSERETVTYDAFGNERSKRIEYSDGSAVVTEYRWAHNTCEEITNEEGVQKRKRTTYNDKAQTVEQLSDCENGSFGCGTVWEYDESGKIQGVFSILSDATRTRTELYEYDDQGNLIRWSELDLEGQTLQQKECQYEEQRLVSDALFERDNETHTTYEYDSGGQLTRSYSISDSSEIETVYSYNTRNLLEMTATRTMDRQYYARLYVYSSASTTWRIYQFYDEQ